MAARPGLIGDVFLHILPHQMAGGHGDHDDGHGDGHGPGMLTQGGQPSVPPYNQHTTTLESTVY